MSRYKITYTETARNCIRHLPPLIKQAIKTIIEKLSEDPYVGKPLRAELAGYWSCRFQRWRIIYILEKKSHLIEIQLIEKRVSVYETLKNISH
jgi:mRNA interferase RelE/StbE